MPRYTVAYSDLVRRLAEVETILRKGREASRQPATPNNISLVNALCRSGVVLLSSHIEGYIEDLGEIAIHRIASQRLLKASLGSSFRYYFSRDLIAEIKDTKEPARIASKLDELIIRDGHIWDTNPTFYRPLPATSFLADFANPTHEDIRKFFRRFGYDQYNTDLARRLTTNFSACSNMVNHVVAQRNAIAHGDMVTAGTPTDLANMINLVRLYCRETDHVVGNWFRARQCTIR